MMDDPAVVAAIVGGFFGVLGGLGGAALRFWMGRADRQETARLAREAHAVATALKTSEQQHEREVEQLRSQLGLEVERALIGERARYGTFRELQIKVVPEMWARLFRYYTAVSNLAASAPNGTSELHKQADETKELAYRFLQENALLVSEELFQRLDVFITKLYWGHLSTAGPTVPWQRGLQVFKSTTEGEIRTLLEGLRRDFRGLLDDEVGLRPGP